jgi:type IV secretory pathway TrbF-like protein
LVIGELVQDPAKKWRFIRVASVALAVLNEGSFAYRVHQERKEREDDQERAY